MRRAVAWILIYCLALSFMIVFVPSTVEACSCAERPTVEAQFKRSEAVFAGLVVEVKEQRSFRGNLTKAALFEVSQVWKGGPESQIIVNTGSGGGDCGFGFEEGQEYIVYAQSSSMYGDKELLTTIICDRTDKLASAQEDLTLLGEGKAPTERVNLASEFDSKALSVWLNVLGVAVVIAFIGVIVLLVRRRGRK